MKVIVLGGGLVGGPIAMDLAQDNEFDVTLADKDSHRLASIKALSPNIHTQLADLSDSDQLTRAICHGDFVVNAVPGFMGFNTLNNIINAKKNAVDIAFYPENPLDLHHRAIDADVRVIVDCGVAPGMSNLLAAWGTQQLDEAHDICIYVGGLPKIRTWPYEYKAVFSPRDVIEEYTRPARIVLNGTVHQRDALSEIELLSFPHVGTLEAFNSDGLRTLIHTLSVPNMKEKTLRYPGHGEKMRLLRETGFFNKTPVIVNGTPIRPLDMTEKLLFPKWQLEPGEKDLTVMQVTVTGIKNGAPTRYTSNLYDEYCPTTNIHSMARTTGYTASLTIRLLAKQSYTQTGISPLEYLGAKPECVSFILDGLRRRNVIYSESLENI